MENHINQTSVMKLCSFVQDKSKKKLWFWVYLPKMKSIYFKFSYSQSIQTTFAKSYKKKTINTNDANERKPWKRQKNAKTSTVMYRQPIGKAYQNYSKNQWSTAVEKDEANSNKPISMANEWNEKQIELI